MKAEKKTSIKLKFNSEEYLMFLEIVRKVIDGESPLHEIAILNRQQLDFLKKLQKTLNE